MRKFGFIVHPVNQQHLRQVLSRVSSGKCGTTLKVLIPSDGGGCFTTEPIRFRLNGVLEEVECLGIVCPLTPSEMVTKEAEAVERVLEAINVAKDYGAQLVGLGGFTSIIGSNGSEIAHAAPVAVTSGNTCTVVAVIDSIDRATKLLDIDMKKSVVAIVGATGDIGSACARVLASRCRSLVIVARNENRLNLLADELKKLNSVVEVERRPSTAARKADILITATSSYTTLIESNDIRRGSVVCDVSYPANISKEIREFRKDVLIFEGGMVRWPELFQQVPSEHPFLMFNLPVGAHGCFGEALLLTTENRVAVYTIGRGNISSRKLEEMGRFFRKYRMSPADFWHGRGSYSEDEIESIRRARLVDVSSESVHVMER